MAEKTKTKHVIKVYKCPTHGEQEVVDFTETIAYCPHCGKQMEYVNEYEEWV